ncbi:FecR family protein [Sphingomonas floccifaciens]|uniref:FecR family protein n=1 Tax=Sphingomonas floccifaciens TaxID=1844115 RepID=A0ABW4NA52_9SPHN
MQAAYWHARLSGGGDVDDDPAFARWQQANAANGDAFARVSARHDGIRALADAPEILSLRHQTLARLAMKRQADRRMKAATGVALAIALLATPFVAFRAGWFEPTRDVAAAPSVAARGEQTFRTAVGQRLALTLGDGSRVMLDTASRVRVNYAGPERLLALDEGQAWFEVAKDRTRPFVVRAGGQRVVAHGTAFDIRVMPGRTEVMLAEGRVTVDSGRAGDAGVAMQPNQLLVAAANGTLVSRVTDPERYTSWRSGVVTFDRVPLSQAVAEMNRYSDTKLSVADAATGRIVVSGGFAAGATDAFVEALTVGFGVKGRRDAAGNMVLSAPR